MASAQSDQSRVLQEELTCPVCLDLYRDPHMLPCGHNFCKSCLNRLRLQAERGRFRCPECRDSHRCNTAIHKNFKLANIADDYRRRRRAAIAAAAVGIRQQRQQQQQQPSSSVAAKTPLVRFAVPCDYCPAVAAEASGPSSASAAAAAAVPPPPLAVKTCLKCEVSMCQEHVKPHLELPAFREHLLTEPMNDFWKRKCPYHDEIFKYYCMEDKMCVCNACTIEGGHAGHTIKTLKNTMKDLKVALDKQLYRVDRKYSLAEKKLQEQKEKERQNKKFKDDTDQCLLRLSEEMKARVMRFAARLRECSLAHYAANGPAIQKNITRICQDQARLQEVRCGLESLLQENDPFRFIEAYKTTGKQCRKQLRKTMFYPEYVDMETEALGLLMEEEMKTFLNEQLPCPVLDAINSLCQVSDQEEEEEQDDVEGEAADEDEEEDDEDDEDELDDSSEEEFRSGPDEEDEDDDEEEEAEEEEQNQSDQADDNYSPEEEEEEEEEDGDEDEDEEDDDDEEEERGV